jgi:hypothetical protein
MGYTSRYIQRCTQQTMKCVLSLAQRLCMPVREAVRSGVTGENDNGGMDSNCSAQVLNAPAELKYHHRRVPNQWLPAVCTRAQ